MQKQYIVAITTESLKSSYALPIFIIDDIKNALALLLCLSLNYDF